MSCLRLRRGSQEKTNATSLSGDIDEKYKNAQPFETIELLNTLNKIAIPLIQPNQLPNKKAPLFRTLFLGVHVCVIGNYFTNIFFIVLKPLAEMNSS